MDKIPCDCGEEIQVERYKLGYRVCLKCGEALAKKRKFTVAPMHKSNYVLVSNRDDLVGLNNKGGIVK